jgi:TatD DNase family protein|tara:strand:+ start:127 stop:885 length:759 start_codon:yes stop_codon:yes gene_type:complete
MIDSHCHLDHEPLFSDIENVLERSKLIGIDKILTICTTFDSFNKIINLVNINPMIFGTFGIHPHEADNDIVNMFEIIENVKKSKKIIGIGETGLDFFYNNSEKVKQIDSFKAHIEASLELNIPIIIHSRNAEIDTLKTLNLYKDHKIKILMHCFTGSLEFAKELLKLNSFFSASGIITFKNSLDLQSTFKYLPSDRILIETDSPFLAPIPKRGSKNEPSFIRYTAEKLAEIKNLTFNEIDKITTNNFNKLFF